MKQFIYFFKHTGVTGIKIGRTSGETVNTRFSQFKTYSPQGGEIIGFFECENCVDFEKRIHLELKSNRMYGEWFDISIEHANSIIFKNDHSFRKIKSKFNEWIADENNDIFALYNILNKAVSAEKVKDIPDKKHRKENIIINKLFKPGSVFMKTTSIKKYIEDINPGNEYNINFIGAALRLNGFRRVRNGQIWGYLIDKL